MAENHLAVDDDSNVMLVKVRKQRADGLPFSIDKSCPSARAAIVKKKKLGTKLKVRA